MSLDPHKLKAAELVRLMNSTPLGECLNRADAYRQRDAAGVHVGDGQTFDLIRYAAWLFADWIDARANRSRSPEVR